MQPDPDYKVEKKPGKVKATLRRWKTALKSYSVECWRVLKVTKKPNMEEFKVISKVSGLGILVIGLVGFLIHLIRELLF